MAKLVAEEGALKELVLPFDEGDQWVIGRDPDACQLLVEDLAASRKHAACRKTTKGILIENLSHTNPLLVNDEPLPEPRLLQHGDTVKIGDTIFRYYTESDVQLYDDTNTETNIPANNTPPFPSRGTPTATLEEPPKNNHRHDTIFEEESSQKIELAQVNFDLMDTGRWLLKVVSGPNNGAEFSMQSDASYTLGTDPNSCDIVFYDNSVSRQHAKISISHEDKITIEDLRSRNGTRMDGELLTAPKPLPFNTLVTVGTTSFVVYDREGEMQTIISPLLPSIVKVLQKEEQHVSSTASTVNGGTAATQARLDEEKEKSQKQPAGHTVGALLLTGALVGLFAVVGVAVQTLFFQEPTVVEQPINTDAVLTEAMQLYPGVKSSFNKNSGRLLLVGHVLTVVDKNQLLYDLQNIKFIKDIDDSGVVIDEFVWGEANQVLSKNPQWRGITVHSPEPGRFVVSGYLQSRDQASGVWEYLTRNFPYIDRLENKVVVEEDILQKVTTALHNYGLGQITPKMVGGELILSGNIPADKSAAYDEALKEFRDVAGVRSVRSQVAEQARSESVINISSQYVVSGVSRVDQGHLNVVINGRILTVGDVLDGMRILSVEPHAVYLEKDGLRYKIDIPR